MSKVKSDPLEQPADLGPLFAEPRTLSHPADPQTSRDAAVRAVASGRVAGDALYLLDLITRRPGRTMEEYGYDAVAETKDLSDEISNLAFKWRIRLGRRTGTLKARGLIHQKGERDGLGLWWPGDGAAR